jgi:hypothetical protein
MLRLLLICLMLSNLFALGGVSSLPDDEKAVVQRIDKALDIDENNGYEIYTGLIQGYLTHSKHWNVDVFDNDSPSTGKMKNSKNKTLFMDILNDDRLVNISMFKFPNINQIMIYIVESLPRSNSVALKAFNKFKNDSSYIKKIENSNFTYFSSKNKMERVNIHVSSDRGVIQYTSLYVFNLE